MKAIQIVDAIFFTLLILFFYAFVWLGLSISNNTDSVMWGRGLISKQMLEFHQSK